MVSRRFGLTVIHNVEWNETLSIQAIAFLGCHRSIHAIYSVHAKIPSWI